MTLRTQYRMCSDIMAMANALTYGGRLRCGNVLVEHGMLSTSGSTPEPTPAWLQQASCHIQLGILHGQELYLEVVITDAALLR